MPDHGRLSLQLADNVGVMVGHLCNRLMGEDLRMRLRLLDRRRIIRPSRRQGRVAGLREDGGPAVPTAWQQPEAMDKYHGCASARVRLSDLVGGDAGYSVDHREPTIVFARSSSLELGTSHSTDLAVSEP